MKKERSDEDSRTADEMSTYLHKRRENNCAASWSLEFVDQENSSMLSDIAIVSITASWLLY